MFFFSALWGGVYGSRVAIIMRLRLRPFCGGRAPYDEARPTYTRRPTSARPIRILTSERDTVAISMRFYFPLSSRAGKIWFSVSIGYMKSVAILVVPLFFSPLRCFNNPSGCSEA